MELEGLSPELLEKAKACKTSEDLTALMEAEGIELKDEMLETVAAGIGQEGLLDHLGSMGCLIP